ncbi:MAG: hypothetical protein AB7E96_00405 [Deferribacterales bacterium]
MKSFIISCDFRGRVEDESAAAGVLNRYNGIRIKRDTWYILSDDSAGHIFDTLKEAAPGIYIFLAELTQGQMISQPWPVRSWFNKNCGD